MIEIRNIKQNKNKNIFKDKLMSSLSNDPGYQLQQQQYIPGPHWIERHYQVNDPSFHNNQFTFPSNNNLNNNNNNSIFDFAYPFHVPKTITNNRFTIPGKRGVHYYLTPEQCKRLEQYSRFVNDYNNPWTNAILTQNNDSWLSVSSTTNIFPEFFFDLTELLKNTRFEVTPPVYGNFKQPRDIAFASDFSIGYKYSKNMIPSQPLNEMQKNLLNLVNMKFAENMSTKYNGILINYYENQDNSIGAHSDDETSLGPNGVISIVFGETRIFRIRNLTFPNQVYVNGTLQYFYENKQKASPIIYDLNVQSGMVIWMGGAFQRHFQHEIPKSSSTLGPRISFTFRAHTE